MDIGIAIGACVPLSASRFSHVTLFRLMKHVSNIWNAMNITPAIPGTEQVTTDWPVGSDCVEHDAGLSRFHDAAALRSIGLGRVQELSP